MNKIEIALEDCANLIVDVAMDEAPVDTGDLKNAIEHGLVKKSGHGYEVMIGVNGVHLINQKSKTNYAPFVHFGTAAHFITPKKKGGTLFIPGIGCRKYVEHPGTQANPFLDRAIKATEREVTEKLGSALIAETVEYLDDIFEDV